MVLLVAALFVRANASTTVNPDASGPLGAARGERQHDAAPGAVCLASLVWFRKRDDGDEKDETSNDVRSEIGRLQAAVEISERRLHDLVHGLDAVVWEAQADETRPMARRYTFISQRVETMLGYPLERWLSDAGLWSEVVDADEREQVARQTSSALAGERKDHELEYKARTSDGRVVWLRELVRVTPAPSGPVHLRGVMVDVTARRTLEAQLRQAQKMEAIGRLAGGVAHDFNNLLTVITGYGEQILNSLPEGDEMRVGVDAIVNAADRACSLTQQLLAFSRRQMREPRILDVNSVMNGMGKMLQRVIGEDVNLVIVPANGLWPIAADPNQLEQVILNLAVNARDAMPGGGTLTIETGMACLDEAYFVEHQLGGTAGDFVMLAVSDTGSGMSAEVRQHLFEPFFTTKESGRGTGLGLSTVYGIVKQNGGYIWVYSEPGRGTSFKIYLPRAVGPVDDSRNLAGPAEAPGGSESVLVVEDDSVVRQLVCESLRLNGYAVFEAEDGAEALRFFEGHPGTIDLLVTDVVMPNMNGCEAAARLRSGHPDLAVLYMSGYTDHAIVHQSALEPGAEFLQKPFTPSALARRVREVLDRQRASRARGSTRLAGRAKLAP
jgi:two-component system cell cycle sensor histidine kinase/response regulator CckA